MRRLLSFAVLLLALHCALAMPDHPASMRMSGELSHEVDMHNETATNRTSGITITVTSVEEHDDDTGDETEDEDDEDMKNSCPPRMPEIVEIEQQCLAEYRKMKKGDTCMEPPTKNILVIRKESPNSGTIRLESVPDSRPSEETTDSPKRKLRPHSSYYYHCLLKKLNWLTEYETLSKPITQAWIEANVTDATLKEQALEQLNECLVRVKKVEKVETDVTESSTESTEETEQSTEISPKKQEQMNCIASLQLVCCLHRAECPLIKYP